MVMCISTTIAVCPAAEFIKEEPSHFRIKVEGLTFDRDKAASPVSVRQRK
jgi:hypothetical protein